MLGLRVLADVDERGTAPGWGLSALGISMFLFAKGMSEVLHKDHSRWWAILGGSD